MVSISKHIFRVSCSSSGIGHPPHRSGCVSGADFDLVSWSSLWTFLRLCCVLCLCMSLAKDSANGGFVLSCLYMSWSLSSLLFPIVHMVVPSGLCSVVRVFSVGCCVSSYRWVGCVSRSGFMGVVEKVRLGDLHPSSVLWLDGGVHLFVIRRVCVLCLHCARAFGPLSLSKMVDSSCHAGCQCTS